MAKIHGLIAEFDSPSTLLKAGTAMRDKGFKQFDCHSPFPIHGMDNAMGLKRSPLGYIIAFFAIIGGLIGLGLQTWVHSIVYPLILSGKPFFAWQAYIVVTFALIILFGAFGAVFGMLGLNKLPRYHHYLFYSDKFKKFSDDGFFVSIGADDEKFDKIGTTDFLQLIGGKNIEVLEGEE
ncbi:MAG: DUF3341 domain-containing protein [Candidatus Neomarinimicrobiota bacterium]